MMAALGKKNVENTLVISVVWWAIVWAFPGSEVPVAPATRLCRDGKPCVQALARSQAMCASLEGMWSIALTLAPTLIS